MLYLYRNDADQDITATAHFNWDFKGGSRVQPYLAGHIGVLRHYTPRFAVNSWTYGAGLGVRHPPRSGWLDELGRLKGGRA